jgi:TolA-binding protein
MRCSLSGLTLLLIALVGFGCATRSSVREVSARVDGLAKDVANLRQQQDGLSKGLGATSNEVQALNVRLTHTDSRLREVGDRVQTLGNRIAATESSIREAIGALEALAKPAPVPPPGASPPRESSYNVEQAFAAALKTFTSGEYGQAVLELLDLIAKRPEHPLAARAQLWIGEAYFRQRDYRQALLEYRKAVDFASDASVIADGWVKIGQTHAMLRQRAEAAAAWQRVLREYPDTEAAGRARSLLRK